MRSWWMESGPLMEEASDGKGAGGGDGKGDKGKGDEGKGSDKGGVPDANTTAALTLYNALQDPDTSLEVIKSLASRAGLLRDNDDKSDKGNKGDKDDKKGSRAAKLMRIKLGKDYDKFSDILGPALDEILEDRLEEIRRESGAKDAKTHWTGQIDKFMETHTLTKEIEDQMQELMEDSPPNVGRDGFDAQRYLRRMYKNAIEELDIEAPEPPKKSGDKGKKRVDIHTLKNPNTGEEEFEVEVQDAPKGATLDDAVEAAMKGIRFKRRGER